MIPTPTARLLGWLNGTLQLHGVMIGMISPENADEGFAVKFDEAVAPQDSESDRGEW